MNRFKNHSSVLVVLAAMLLASAGVNAQKLRDRNGVKENLGAATGAVTVHAQVVNGDTVPVKYLPYVTVVAERKFDDPAEARRWARLKHNVKKVYPYAKLAAEKLEKYADEIAAEDSDRRRKRYYKKIEEELKAEYEDDMRSLTMTQGTILIKLIDRETGNTSYDVVKEFRGGFSAFFWQGVSRMFGQDLKSEYDPEGEDREIEAIVLMIEAGKL